MNKSIYLAASLFVLTLAPVFGQQVHTIDAPPGQEIGSTPRLTKFNLDFPGGTPRQLVAAIEHATGKPLNAIIPAEDATMALPPLKMNNVDVSQLFEALKSASTKTETYVTGTFYNGPFPTPNQNYQTIQTCYGFQTSGNPADNSIWYFYIVKPPPPRAIPTKACRFYQLAPYLERGLTVDDITTAIQTGWKMQGDTAPPDISFHKETKLLIAVGEPDKLDVIDAVLKALQSPKVKPPPEIDPTTGLPLPKERSKVAE
jgi:hypothetical protein